MLKKLKAGQVCIISHDINAEQDCIQQHYVSLYLSFTPMPLLL